MSFAQPVTRLNVSALPSKPNPAIIYVLPDGKEYLGARELGSSGAVGTLPQGIHAPDPDKMTVRRTSVTGITLAWTPSADNGPTAASEYAALGTAYVAFNTQAEGVANARYLGLRHSLGLSWSAPYNRLDSGLTASNGASFDTSQGGAGIEIVVQGSWVAFGFMSNAVGRARIKIESEYLSGADSGGYVVDPAGISTSGNKDQSLKITFPYAGRWRVFFGASRIKHIFVSPGGYLAPAEPMPIGLGFGDSIASRINSAGDGAEFGCVNQLAGLSMGIDMIPLGQGGTGFVGQATTYRQGDGLQWVIDNRPSLDPAYVWGFGTNNDFPNVALLQQRVEEFIGKALAGYGSRSLRNVIITSAYNGFEVDDVKVNAVNAQLKAAVAAINDPRVYYVPVDGADGDSTPIFTGTGSVANRTGNGNADFYFSTPTQGAGDRHPNRAGVLHAAESYAWQIWQAIAYGRRDWK